MNLERAIHDQQWYSENTKRLKVTDAWLDGSKSIRESGKKAINSLLNSAKTKASSLSGLAKSIKGFF